MDSEPVKMPFKHRLILALIPVAALLVRIIGWTMRIRLTDAAKISPGARPAANQIYAFWHNQQLLACYFFRNHGIQVLVSRSKDGDYIAKALECFGFGTVRSSTSSGKLNALRGLARQLHAGRHVAITPDGPRGPIYQAQPGAVFLAMLSGHTVAPFGCAVDRAWRLKSWDRFEIPQPFSRAAIVYGEPMRIPAKMSDAEVAQWVQRLQDTLTELHHKALQEIAHKPS